MHLIAGQHTLDDLNPVLTTNLPDDRDHTTGFHPSKLCGDNWLSIPDINDAEGAEGAEAGFVISHDQLSSVPKRSRLADWGANPDDWKPGNVQSRR